MQSSSRARHPAVRGGRVARRAATAIPPTAEEIAGKARTLRADALAPPAQEQAGHGRARSGSSSSSSIAVTADLWAPQLLGDPIAIDTTTAAQQRLQPPSCDHPFGTDKLGRDIASRVVYGARVSLIGRRAGRGDHGRRRADHWGRSPRYYGGIWDAIIMRMADVFFAFPYILFAIALIAVLGRGLQNVFIAIGMLGWPSIARVFRSSILSVKENEYVDAARAMGASTRRILFRHIMPNAVAPIIVYATMSVGGAILTEAALSFLGMGVQPPDALVGQHARRSPLLHVHGPLAHDLSRASPSSPRCWPSFCLATVCATPST